MKIKLRIKNLDDVLEDLLKQPELVQAVLDQAVEAAADVVLEAAKSKAPGPGLDKQRVGKGRYEVGPKAANWYYRFLEVGTKAHTVKPKHKKALLIGGWNYAARSKPGAIAAKPFLRPAIDEKKDAAADAAGEIFKKALE